MWEQCVTSRLWPVLMLSKVGWRIWRISSMLLTNRQSPILSLDSFPSELIPIKKISVTASPLCKLEEQDIKSNEGLNVVIVPLVMASAHLLIQSYPIIPWWPWRFFEVRILNISPFRIIKHFWIWKSWRSESEVGQVGRPTNTGHRLPQSMEINPKTQGNFIFTF